MHAWLVRSYRRRPRMDGASAPKRSWQETSQFDESAAAFFSRK